MKILVAEDDPITGKLIKAALHENIQIIVVGNGFDALKELRSNKGENKFAILVTDVNMPGMDGYLLADNIRNDPDPEVNTITIIMYSGAKASQDNIELAIRKKVDRYIEKTGVREIQQAVDDEMIKLMRRALK